MQGSLLADTFGNVFIVVAAAAIVGGLVGLWFISRVTPKGTVLAIAAGLYVLSFLIPPGTSREWHGVVGIMRMLGFAGGVLGIIDLLKKRKPTTREAAPVAAELATPPPSTPQQIQCPKCQRQFKFRQELLGKKVKCPCGESFSVPPLRPA